MATALLSTQLLSYQLVAVAVERNQQAQALTV
jgi:hypothetical protein